jgi:hypothetical protein
LRAQQFADLNKYVATACEKPTTPCSGASGSKDELEAIPDESNPNSDSGSDSDCSGDGLSSEDESDDEDDASGSVIEQEGDGATLGEGISIRNSSAAPSVELADLLADDPKSCPRVATSPK